MDSILWLYQTQKLIIISTTLADKVCYPYKKGDLSET